MFFAALFQMQCEKKPSLPQVVKMLIVEKGHLVFFIKTMKSNWISVAHT